YVKKKNRRLFWRRISLLTLTMLTALLTLYGSLRLYAQITGAPSLSVPKASVFLDNNDHQIGDKFTAERRYWVGLDEISPFVLDAVIATEDRNFYEHHGFDFKRIAGAILKDVKTRRKAEGASS
ncbi:transglycosylase domain-containing protein, partial [Microvirga sp. 3-52]|nr:transglycosylase domain-containing protein [Microvirga sp. 3-52]